MSTGDDWPEMPSNHDCIQTGTGGAHSDTYYYGDACEYCGKQGPQEEDE